MTQLALWKGVSRTLAAAFLICLAGFPVAAQHGGMTLPQNLDELVGKSTLILRGRILSARHELHPEYKALHTIVITLRVDETWKGQSGATYSFRQYIWDARDRFDFAGYKKGQQVVLFLNSPSEIGLSTTIGLEQGRFLIGRESDGSLSAVNGHANASLFRNLNTRVKARGFRLPPRLESMALVPAPAPIPLADLREFVRELSRGR